MTTTMDAIALTALRDSITHWTRNVAAETPEDVRLGPHHCACCVQFLFIPNVACTRCPISKKTGASFCWGTPNAAATRAFRQWDQHRTAATRDAWRVAAQAMLDFLRSLLPKEKLS